MRLINTWWDIEGMGVNNCKQKIKQAIPAKGAEDLGQPESITDSI